MPGLLLLVDADFTAAGSTVPWLLDPNDGRKYAELHCAGDCHGEPDDDIKAARIAELVTRDFPRRHLRPFTKSN